MKRKVIIAIVISLIAATILSAQEYASDRVIVKYRSSAKTFGKEIIAHFKRTGIVVKGVDAKKGVKKTLEELRQDPSVLYAEPDYVLKALVVPNDPYFKYLENLTAIDMPQAWEYTLGSREIIVGVVDTGIDYTHPDLAGNMWVNTKEIPDNGKDDDGNGFIDDVYGYDFKYNRSDPMDTDGHGTHCAGIIGALWNNGIGVAGVTPRVCLMALKFLDPGLTSDAIRAIEYGVAHGAHVLSNSWGGGEYSQALKDAIEMAGAHGVTFVAAAGNASMDTDIYPTYPSCYPLANIISVGASYGHPDDTDDITFFSNFGRKSVDIFAPGYRVLSTIPKTAYDSYSGTSMACPHVSGTVALILSLESNMRPEYIRDIIINSAEKNRALKDLCVSGGRLNAWRALREVAEFPFLSVNRVILSGGDGDSLAEPGETLSLAIEIKNSANMLTGATAVLRSPGGEVDIIQGESSYPDTPSNFSSVNTSPYIVRVKPSSVFFQSSPLILEIRSNGDYYKELVVPFRTGRECDVLIVDDDGGSSREEHLVAALESLGYRVAVWSILASGVPPLEELRPSVVLWHTGNMIGQIFSTGELNKLCAYLDLGGAVIVSGSNWLDQLGSGTISTDYLRIAPHQQGGLVGTQTGFEWLSGVQFAVNAMDDSGDFMRPLVGAKVVAGQGTSAGCAVYYSGDGIKGPALSFAFDASMIDRTALRALLDRSMRKVLRPRIINATPRNGAAEIAWTAPRVFDVVEIFAKQGNIVQTRLTDRASILFSGLSNDVTYAFSVRAMFENNFVSEYSTTIYCKPSANGGAPLASVSAMTVIPDEKGLTFAWIGVPDGRCTGYALEVHGRSGLVTAIMTKDVFARARREFLSATDLGVAWVCPLDEQGNRGEAMKIAWEYRDVYPPQEPYNIRVEELPGRKLKVSWIHSDSADVAGYIIDIAPREGEYGEPVRFGKVNEAHIINASRGIPHFIRLRAVDDAGNVSPGTVMQFGESGYNGSLSGCGCSGGSDNAQEASAAILVLNHFLSLILVGFAALLRAARRIFL